MTYFLSFLALPLNQLRPAAAASPNRLGQYSLKQDGWPTGQADIQAGQQMAITIMYMAREPEFAS